jgi:hypothetical protein
VSLQRRKVDFHPQDGTNKLFRSLKSLQNAAQAQKIRFSAPTFPRLLTPFDLDRADKLEQVVVANFDELEKAEYAKHFQGMTHGFNAFGTTRSDAGGADAFRRIGTLRPLNLVNFLFMSDRFSLSRLWIFIQVWTAMS